MTNYLEHNQSEDVRMSWRSATSDLFYSNLTRQITRQNRAGRAGGLNSGEAFCISADGPPGAARDPPVRLRHAIGQHRITFPRVPGHDFDIQGPLAATPSAR